MSVCMQKINFIPPFFIEVLQRYYKFAILGTLGMLGYDQWKQYCQLVENSNVHLYSKKIIFIPHLFLEILQSYCKLVTLGTLCIPGHANLKQQHQHVGNWCLSTCKKSTWSLKDITLQSEESCNLIGQ